MPSLSTRRLARPRGLVAPRLPRSSSELAAYRAELLRLVREAFAGPAWHGSSVRRTLRGVDAEEALWRGPGTQNRIWDIVLHLAYTRHIVCQRLDPAHTATFPMVVERSWWPRLDLSGTTPEVAWRRDRAMLEQQQRRLVELVELLPPRRLVERRPGKPHVFGVEISGVALHDTYHGGQIALIRRIRRDGEGVGGIPRG